jgi:hypothetical protein
VRNPRGLTCQARAAKAARPNLNVALNSLRTADASIWSLVLANPLIVVIGQSAHPGMLPVHRQDSLQWQHAQSFGFPAQVHSTMCLGHLCLP